MSMVVPRPPGPTLYRFRIGLSGSCAPRTRTRGFSFRLEQEGLLSIDFEDDDSDSSSDTLAYGWTINTKYYTADVSMWMAHLYDQFSVTGVPMFDQVAALVMVFDLNNLSTFSELKKWVSGNNIQNFDILLCIGNKADLVPGHAAHVEYRRRQLNLDESSDFGISETEGTSLLGDDDSSLETKRSCMDWCLEHNIEYIEACLSVDGDSQGVERLLGALSAHMWPGMVLKSGDTINQPTLPEQEDSSDEEEPNYELEYEILSAGSVEPWDDTDVSWISATNDTPTIAGGDMQASTSQSQSQPQEEIDIERERAIPEAHEELEEVNDADKHFELEDMEQLMSEIGNMRDSLRLMPDFQRREMAANLAMKMASMFGDSSGDEGEI
ncbi:GTP binding protein [Tanacetum coccineum]|uniref:GTP binding protein n=1 Tax=Tanacetum coccineum TaxID=301880 RepID=A0ABQ4WKC4_9ASTR